MRAHVWVWLILCTPFVCLVACNPGSDKGEAPSNATLILAGVTLRDPGAERSSGASTRIGKSIHVFGDPTSEIGSYVNQTQPRSSQTAHGFYGIRPPIHSGTTLQSPPPDPTGLSAQVDSDTAITLSWTSGGGSTADYRASYQTGATAPADCASGTTISEASISGTSHQVTGLTAATEYSFRVCAINANLTPDVSAGVTVTDTTQP